MDLYIPSRTPRTRDGSTQVRIVEPFRMEGNNREQIVAPAGARIDLDHGFIAFEDASGKEQKFMLQLQPSQHFTPGELDNWLGGYPFPEFRGEQACQDIPVDIETFLTRNFDESYAFVPVNTRADNESPPNEVSATSATTTDTVLYHRLATFIPRITAAMSRYDVAGANLRLVMRLMRLNKELETWGPSGIFTTAGNWAAGHAPTLGAGYQWFGSSGGGPGVNSDPIADMFALRHKSPLGGAEMEWWFNGRVGQGILQHPAIQSFMRFKSGDDPQPDNVSALRDGRSVVDWTLKGLGTFHMVTGQYQATVGAALDYIMPDMIVANVKYPGTPTNGMELASAYSWQLKWPTSGTAWNTRELQIEGRGAGGTLIIVETARKLRLVGRIAGGMVDGLNQG